MPDILISVFKFINHHHGDSNNNTPVHTQWKWDKFFASLSMHSGCKSKSCGTTWRQCSALPPRPGSSQRRRSSLPPLTSAGWSWWGPPTRPKMSYSAAPVEMYPSQSYSVTLGKTSRHAKSRCPPTCCQREWWVFTNSALFACGMVPLKIVNVRTLVREAVVWLLILMYV